MKRIVNNRPIVFSAISLVAGMTSRACFNASSLFYVVLSLFLVGFILCFFVKPIKQYKFEILIIALFFVFGNLYTLYNVNLYESDCCFSGKSDLISGTVCKIYASSDKNQTVTLTDLTIGNIKTYGNALVRFSDQSLVCGQNVSFNGNVTFIPFSLESYSSKTSFRITPETIISVNSPSSVFYIVSNHVKNVIDTNVSGDEAGVMIALVLGDTSKIASDTLDNFRLSGISHIFAVSGLHVVFFSSLISAILGFCKIKGVKNTVISAMFCIFYAGLCGFPVSCVRAVIMSVTLNFVKNAGRKYDALNSLFLSLIIVVAIFPNTLFSYGLILSYLAVLSIAVCSKIFEEFFGFLPETIRQSLSVSFAVSYIMTPVLFKMFGYASVITVFLNVFIVPVVSILYTLTFFSTLIVSVVPFFGIVFKLPYYVVYFINSVLEELNVVSFSVNSTVSVLSLILYYLFAFVFIDRTNFKKPVKLISGLLSVATLILAVFGVL